MGISCQTLRNSNGAEEPTWDAWLRKQVSFLFFLRNAFQSSSLVYPPGPAVPHIDIIELDPPANQDASAIAQVEAIIQDEQPENQDDSIAEHSDIRQASVVSRRDGPAVPYVAFSDDSV